MEITTAIASIATALSAFAAFVTILISRKQLKAAIEQKDTAIKQIEIFVRQNQTSFEDSLAKEYRDLIQKIPLKALLGEDLTEKEYKEAKSYLFQYINLTNDQIFLRSKNRISLEVWNDWQGGIKYNLSLPTFKKFWEEIKPKIKSFEELRELEEKEFNTDPNQWRLKNNSEKKQLK